MSLSRGKIPKCLQNVAIMVQVQYLFYRLFEQYIMLKHN